jgi:hypothetical protein
MALGQITHTHRLSEWTIMEAAEELIEGGQAFMAMADPPDDLHITTTGTGLPLATQCTVMGMARHLPTARHMVRPWVLLTGHPMDQVMDMDLLPLAPHTDSLSMIETTIMEVVVATTTVASCQDQTDDTLATVKVVDDENQEVEQHDGGSQRKKAIIVDPPEGFVGQKTIIVATTVRTTITAPTTAYSSSSSSNPHSYHHHRRLHRTALRIDDE